MANLPDTMTAIEITKAGEPEVLKPGTRAVPKTSQGEVLIKVAAAGVNRPDVMQRKGMYPPPAGASDIPGLEVAGHVVAVGQGVRLRVGDAVTALVAGGGYAEYCVAPEPQCLRVPHGFSMEEAAALPETFFTVWHNLFERGALAKGESVLIHGGSSGIGTAAIQLAREFGAREIFATAGSAAKCQACERLGATRAIDYKKEDFAAVVKAATNNRGVDVVLDMVAGDYLPKNLQLLKQEGRCVVIALQGGATATVSAGIVMVTRLTLTGSTLRPQSIENKGRMARGLKEKVWPFLEHGKIRPILYKTFPLKEAAAAHAELERANHVGKVMLKV